MSESTSSVEKHVRLSSSRAVRLSHLAQTHQVSEDQIVEKALDILFSLSDLFNGDAERRGWSFLAEESLQHVWDNEEDATYDNWKEWSSAALPITQRIRI